ncbi:MAG TPA: hypothetical protein VFQ16_14885 [Burkholderiaceae bacterium]|nr:hypothetical protein [Burkholderiaceae bacterium]
MSHHAPAIVLNANRPDPRAVGGAGLDSVLSEAEAAASDDAADDASLLHLVGAVATALVVLAAAGMVLA